MKISIVGCGSVGSAFLYAIERIPQIELVGVYDPISERCTKVPNEKRYTSFSSLLEIQVDVLLIAAPQNQQNQLIKSALQAEHNVLTPFPLAISRNEALALLNEAKKREQKLIPVNLERYYGHVRDIKKHIGQASIGNISMVEMKRTVPRAFIEWYRDTQCSGGSVYQLLPLDVDTLLYWFGDVKNAYGYCRTAGEMDFAVLSVELGCGALASISGLWGGKEPCRSQYELSGSNGNIRFDSQNSISSIIYDTKATAFNMDMSLQYACHNPFVLCLEDIVARLKTIQMGAVYEHTKRVFEIVETCKTSEVKL